MFNFNENLQYKQKNLRKKNVYKVEHKAVKKEKKWRHKGYVVVNVFGWVKIDFGAHENIFDIFGIKAHAI